MISYLKYLTSIERVTTISPSRVLYGNGTYWCKYVEDGDKSYLGHHARLDLQILCTYETPVKKILGYWPDFPIAIDFFSLARLRTDDEDNAIAALEHPDRVCTVRIAVTGSQLGKIVAVMQESFPVLKCLEIFSMDRDVPVLPAEFLGGSAPCTEKITLYNIPYPTLPTLLLSARDLVSLDLRRIPQNGYISPEIMITSLAALLRLERLTIHFQSSTPRPDRKLPPLVTRTDIPSLISFHFEGACEYLEDLVARIYSPKLKRIFIACLDHHVDSQVAQLCKFIDRSVGSELTPFRRAEVSFHLDRVVFDLHCQANDPSHQRPFGTTTWTTIVSEAPDWQMSDMVQEISQFSATHSTVVHLDLKLDLEDICQLDEANNVGWLNLLHHFPALKVLYVSRELAGPVALALEAITTDMVAELLPFLDSVCLEDQPPSFVEKFVASRQLIGCPVTVVNTKMEFDQRIKSWRR